MDGNCLTRRAFVFSAAASFCLLRKPAEATAAEDRHEFIDDLGRAVVVPQQPGKVVALGINAQTLLVQLCPDCLMSLVKEADESDASDYRAAGISDNVAHFDTGAINSSDIDGVDPGLFKALSPDVMVDAGLRRDGLVEELDELQRQTGVPCFFVDLSFGRLADAYRTLGLMLGCANRANSLAEAVDRIWRNTRDCLLGYGSAPLEVLYAPRMDGAWVSPSIEVQLSALEYLGARVNREAYDYKTSSIDFEAIDGDPPEVIVFDDLSSSEQMSIRQGAIPDLWQSAVDKFCIRTVTAPARMHSWVRSMVFVQSVGLLWLGRILKEPQDDFPESTEVQQFYSLFYGYQPSDIE